jgi:Gas vesicle synthesis protein GvpL/GvpF
MADPTGLGHYVYAVAEASPLTELPGLTGIENAPVSCAVEGRLCALISAVSVQAFRSAQQAAEVSETGWLAGAVRAHERVALHALDRAPVLPMRFGTVYASLDDVHAMLHRHQSSLLAELHRLAGSTEWCLTVRVADPRKDEQPGVAAAASGTAWLLSRQAALQAREAHADRLTERVEQLRTALAAHTREIVVARSGSSNDAVRMWLLVDDVARLRSALDELSARTDPQLQLTGPWPAYHFVRADAVHDDTTHDDTTHADTAHAEAAEVHR